MADVILDVDRDGKYTPFVDRKTTNRPWAVGPTDPTQGTESRSLADAGVSTVVAAAYNHGLSAAAKVSGGPTATSVTTFDGAGRTVVTTTAEDGTRTVETSKQGLLLSTANYGTTGTTPVTSEEYHYDGLGRLRSTYDPAWGTTTYDRRADGEVTKVTYPDGRTTVYGDFDAKTNAPTGTTRPDAKTQGSTLNPLGQTQTAQGAGVLTQRLGYDARTGQLTGLTTFRSGTLDDAGTAATTGWAYDDATGLLTTKTWADDSTDEYKYNAGLQLRETDRPGQATAYAYNNAGELTQTATTDTTHGNLTTLVLTRDDAGRPLLTTQVAQGVGQVFGGSLQTAVNGYTALDQLKLDKSGDTGAGTVYEYYGPTENAGGAAPGALKSATVKKGATVLQQTTYTYDAVTKRPATVTVLAKGQNGAADQTLTYSYTYKPGTDLVAAVDAGAAGTTTYAYEEHTGRLHEVSVADVAGNALYDASYGYNQVDQRTAEATGYFTADDEFVGYTAAYGYDTGDPANAHPIDALASVTRTYTAGGLADESYAYAYDGVGNRTSATANGVAASSAYNGLNQNAAYTYDARGNLTADGAWGYGWDAADRLASATRADGLQRVEFAYDPSGRRMEKRVYARAATTDPWSLDAGATRRYAWDGDVVTAEFDGLNHLRTTYAWGPGGSLLAVTDQTALGGPAVYVPVMDGTGSVVALLAADGSVAATFRYDPYGQLLSAEGSAADVGGYRFAGGWRDGETGLQYHLNRYYSPRDGRFLSRDPTAEAGGLNVYAYAGGDPVNFGDPSGLYGVAAGGPPEYERYGATRAQYDALKGRVQPIRYGKAPPNYDRAALNVMADAYRLRGRLAPLTVDEVLRAGSAAAQLGAERQAYEATAWAPLPYTLDPVTVHVTGGAKVVSGVLGMAATAPAAWTPAGFGALVFEFDFANASWKEMLTGVQQQTETSRQVQGIAMAMGASEDRGEQIGDWTHAGLTLGTGITAAVQQSSVAASQIERHLLVDLSEANRASLRAIPQAAVPAGLRPSNFGVSTIAEDPALHRMWTDAMRSAASSSRRNAYIRSLEIYEEGQAPNIEMLEEAFSAVNRRFVESARAAGHDIAEVHHWNFNKAAFAEQVVDPRHLVPVPSRWLHEEIHRATTSDPFNIWRGPTDPQHVIPIPDFSIPLPPLPPDVPPT